MERARRVTALMVMIVLTACNAPRQAAKPLSQLRVALLYPTQGTKIEMGQAVRTIIEVKDGAGLPAGEAQVQLTLTDASGSVAAVQPAQYGDGEVYRSAAWIIPHRSQAGMWTIQVSATTEAAEGSASTAVEVKESASETLLRKYGFWVDAPRLNGIDPMLMKEQGDAQNGVIIWGGLKPMQHIYLENWVEVQWREGDFHIANADQARDFMLEQIGNFGIYPVRELGTFQPTRFKEWEAWQATARGQLAQYDEQWMIFYAPVAGKTYVIGTMVALPPPGIDPHAALRDGFEVHPEVQANAVAPEPMVKLMGAPEPRDPALGSRFLGKDASIMLRWQPRQALAADEYYLVRVDYNYSESNTLVEFTTRETELQLPAGLYDQPDCGVFNWQVTLMKQTGVAADGQPQGKPLSYDSLYWYVEWMRPFGEQTPFVRKCQNPQT